MKKLPWNWRQKIEFYIYEIRNGDYSLKIEVRFKKGKTIKGFKKYIGSICVNLKLPHYVEHVEIEERFRNKGLGKRLYEMAYDELGEISTFYNDASDEAQRMWRSLIKKYDHKIGDITLLRKDEY